MRKRDMREGAGGVWKKKMKKMEKKSETYYFKFLPVRLN